LWAQLDNYNFWLRKYTVGSGWDNPVNVTNVTDLNICIPSTPCGPNSLIA
jgi:hypothetical protein